MTQVLLEQLASQRRDELASRAAAARPLAPLEDERAQDEGGEGSRRHLLALRLFALVNRP